MIAQIYEQGVNAALAKYADLITPETEASDKAFEDIFKHPVDTAKRWGRTAVSDARRFMFGYPKEYAQQLRSGEAFRHGGLLRNVLTGPPGTGPIGRLLHVGTMAVPTALAVPQLARLPRSHRGEAIGSFAGSLLGGIAGAPLGLVGNIAGSMTGEALGGRIGSLFNKPEAPQDQEYRQEFVPVQESQGVA